MATDRVHRVVEILRDLGPSNPRAVAAEAEARGFPRGAARHWAYYALRLGWEQGLIKRPCHGIYALAETPHLKLEDDRMLAVPHLNGADPEVVQDAIESMTDAFRDLSKLMDQTQRDAQEFCAGTANVLQHAITMLTIMLEATRRDSEKNEQRGPDQIPR